MFDETTRLRRRKFLQGAGAVAATLALDSTRGLHGAAPAPEPWKSLGAAGKPHGILFGFALNYGLLTSDESYAALVARECTIVAPENALKWEKVHPQQDRYDFTQGDALLAFAEKHSMKMRGHAFCWHRSLPPWVTRVVTRENAESVLREHVTTVATRYKGKLHSWDVVNEAIQLRDGLADGWRNSFWHQMLGPRYVDIAFEAAKEADPTAILTYNDFGLEYPNQTDGAKRAAVLAMLTALKKRGVPVEALGLQSHLRAGTGERFGAELQTFIKQVRDLGLEVYITELDVDDHQVKVEGDARDEAVADVYKRYLDVVLATAAIPVVITWGAWDIPHLVGAEQTGGPMSVRPLLFDPQGKPKADAYAVAKAFSDAPNQR